MIFVPIINDIYHTHLTKEDWESLGYTHVAIDVINLFIHPFYILPSTVKTLFLDIRIRSCHKISKQKNLPDTFFLHSPHNGQKIPITSSNLQKMLERFKNIHGIDVRIIQDSLNLPSDYEITNKAGEDAVKGFLYSHKTNVVIKDAKCADLIEPIDENCECYTCKNFTISYLHHLDNVGVPLGTRLGIVHNLHYLSQLNLAAHNN